MRKRNREREEKKREGIVGKAMKGKEREWKTTKVQFPESRLFLIFVSHSEKRFSHNNTHCIVGAPRLAKKLIVTLITTLLNF